MDQQKLNILFLYSPSLPLASTIVDHIKALTTGSQYEVRKLDVIRELPENLDLNRFDAIVIHYTLTIRLGSELSQVAKNRLRDAAPIKVIFIQDEYRHVDATVEALQDLGVSVLFTCVPESEIEKVYPEEKLPSVLKINVLTGYISTKILKDGKPPPIANRSIDVGYRSRRVPAWLGELGQDKVRISERFLSDSYKYGLRCDISIEEKDRIYGPKWDGFIFNCRAVLGVESGASVFDFTGEIQCCVEEEEKLRPDSTFEELRAKYFDHLEGRIRLNQISPRCFEAASHGTLMILYEGHYSGRLIPWRHYVPLKKDHSNMEEVVSILCDDKQAQEIVDCAWAEVALAPHNSFDAFSALVDQTLEEQIAIRPRRIFQPYDMDSFTRATARSRKMHMLFFKRYLGWKFPLLKNGWHMMAGSTRGGH